MMTAKTGETTFTTPSDREVGVTRVFDAPRDLVWKTYTEPEHLRQWMLGPDGWSMEVCEIDLRPGGAYRFAWRKDDGSELTIAGVHREVEPPERLVSTESWGPEWPETINTLVLTEAAGQTTITMTIRYPSQEARDAALRSGMKDGMDQGFARLDGLLASLV